MTVLAGLFCRICQIVRLRFTTNLLIVNDFFPLLCDNYKVVVYEIIFHVAEYQNFLRTELKVPKHRSNSTAVFTRLAFVDARTLGSGVGLLYSMSLF